MAKTFKIQVNPTFQAVVKVPRVGGDPIEVPFTFKTMNRKELAKTFNSWQKEMNDLLSQAKEEEFDLEEFADKEVTLQVRQVKDIVVGWGFDDEFNDENIEELVLTVVSVTDAIISQYNEAYNKARSGN